MSIDAFLQSLEMQNKKQNKAKRKYVAKTKKEQKSMRLAVMPHPQHPQVIEHPQQS